MSEQDNRLDSVFKDKVNSKEIEFREEDWVKARKMIDADRRNRKKRFFMIFFVFLTLISIGTTWYLLPERKTNTTVTTAPATISSGNELPVAATTGTATVSILPGQSETIREAAGNTAEDNASGNNTSPKQTRTALNGDQPVSRKSALRQKEDSHNTGRENRPRKNRIRKPLPPAEDMSYIVTTTDSTTQTDGPASPNKPEEAFFISTKANSPFFKILTTECDTCLKTSASYIAYKRNKEHSKNSLSLEAGTNFYNNGINLQGGLMYNQFVLRTLSLHTGIIYTRIHQDLPARNFSGDDYTFGVLPGGQSIKTQRLDYIEIPLNIGFHITPQHAVMAGASYLYLLQSADLVTTTDITGTQTERRDNGYYTVFNTYDIQAHLSYRFTLNDRWYATAGYYFGLTDITNDKKYGLTQQDRNSGLRINIGVNLW
jgi:hypothetical protein